MNICRFRIELADTCYFYFCGHFYEAFMGKAEVRGATVVKEINLKELISYCSGCRKFLLEVFHKCDSLSDTFFLEARKISIQNYPVLSETKKYLVYVDVDVSDWLVEEKN